MRTIGMKTMRKIGRKLRGGRIWHPQIIPVNLETVPDGGVIWLGE